MHNRERLAIDGGQPVIDTPLPKGVSGPSVFGDEEAAAAERVIRGDIHFRYHGPNDVALFEEEASRRLGVNHALMVNSGTSALACGLAGLGVGPGDEVIVPGYTYIATPAAVVAVGAVPVIAEIDNSLGNGPSRLGTEGHAAHEGGDPSAHEWDAGKIRPDHGGRNEAWPDGARGLLPMCGRRVQGSTRGEVRKCRCVEPELREDH